jgi:hypothetical protein
MDRRANFAWGWGVEAEKREVVTQKILQNYDRNDDKK